jgi:hypothetical protein
VGFSQKAVGVVYVTAAFASENLGSSHALSVDFFGTVSQFKFWIKKSVKRHKNNTCMLIGSRLRRRTIFIFLFIKILILIVIFLMGWQVGSTSMSAPPPHVQPSQPLQMGPIGQSSYQNTFRRESVQFVTPRPKNGRFFKKLPKQVLTCDISPKYGSFL